jgi:mRNA-degrading endonuclease RelE of RelBE toxin-antitoxin system
MNIEISRAFVKDVEALPKRAKGIILNLIEEIQAETTKSPFDIKECSKLKGCDNLYRIRRGIYRVVIEYNNDGIVILKRVQPRGQIYKKK